MHGQVFEYMQEEDKYMSLEFVRETIKVNRIVGEDLTQTVVENDIIVPDVKPDVSRILLLDGDVCVNSTEVVQDKALVNGSIRYKILYIPDEPEQSVKSINASSTFSCSLDIPDSRQGMRCRAKSEIEHMEYNILNGRKINVKSVVKLSGKVEEEVEQDVIGDMRGLDNVQVLKNNINVNCYVGNGDGSYTWKESLEIPSGKPPIREILRNDIKITGKDYKIADNKIIAKGELNISTLYIGDDEERSIQFMEHEAPFTQFIDMNGISGDAECDLDFQVLDSQFEPWEDSDGEMRMLNCEVALDISASGFSRTSVDVIEDAYSPHMRLGLEKKPFKVEEVIAENRSQVTIKDTASLQNDEPEIAEVFNVLSKPSLSEYRILDDKIIIEGVVNNNVLYLANNTEQPVFCHRQEIPFRHNIDVKGVKPGMVCDVGLDAEHCNYSMVSGTEVEVRLVVCVNVKVLDHAMIPLISKVTEQPADEKRLSSQPSITIYFSQPGDTLWKIAKRYFTTVEDLKAVNNLGDNDTIIPGKQIIIPKRVS